MSDKVTIKFVPYEAKPATKNCFRFVEEGEKDDHMIGQLYVQKKLTGGVQPASLTVTLQAEA